MWGKDPPRMPTAEAKGEHNMIPVSQTVTLVAGPAPADPCTLLTVRTSPGAMEFGFESLTLADDSDSLTLDWGDGTVETITETVRERTHTYAAAGLHIIRLSDDVRTLQVTGDYDPTYAFARYRLLPVAFRSTATRLTSLGSMALAGCTNLTSFDVSTAQPVRPALRRLHGSRAHPLRRGERSCNQGDVQLPGRSDARQRQRRGDVRPVAQVPRCNRSRGTSLLLPARRRQSFLERCYGETLFANIKFTNRESDANLRKIITHSV